MAERRLAVVHVQMKQREGGRIDLEVTQKFLVCILRVRLAVSCPIRSVRAAVVIDVKDRLNRVGQVSDECLRVDDNLVRDGDQRGATYGQDKRLLPRPFRTDKTLPHLVVVFVRVAPPRAPLVILLRAQRLGVVEHSLQLGRSPRADGVRADALPPRLLAPDRMARRRRDAVTVVGVATRAAHAPGDAERMVQRARAAAFDGVAVLRIATNGLVELRREDDASQPVRIQRKPTVWVLLELRAQENGREERIIEMPPDEIEGVAVFVELVNDQPAAPFLYQARVMEALVDLGCDVRAHFDEAEQPEQGSRGCSAASRCCLARRRTQKWEEAVAAEARVAVARTDDVR